MTLSSQAFAGPAEDFCKAMQDQFIACKQEAAKNGSCINAVESMIGTYFETSKAANSAQRDEMDKAVNLWADMVKTINPQGDESPKMQAIAALCEQVRQAK